MKRYGLLGLLALGLLLNTSRAASPGETWTRRLSLNLDHVSYGNGTFVAVGSYGTVLTSRDGTT
jgi:hypothetical protein